MAIFDNFPWTNVHELNLDWIVKKIKELYQDTQNLETALNQIKENLSDDNKRNKKIKQRSCHSK